MSKVCLALLVSACLCAFAQQQPSQQPQPRAEEKTTQSKTSPAEAKKQEKEQQEQEQREDPMFRGLHYRNIGPFRGGRSITVTGIPGNPNVYYFGSVGGGVWKSADAALTWDPVFDKEDNGDIGSIAVAPSDPNIVYVGTGEACIRGNISHGDGMYKSTDAGKSWTRIGLDDTQTIAKVVVDPRNPDIVLVAALGHVFGPNKERGIFRSADGGKTWQHVLYKDENTGAVDIAFDPHNSHILYASLWQANRSPWGFSSGGPGSGLYKSTDGGLSWRELKGHGLPEGVYGKIGVSVAANSDRVYALIEAKDGGLYRSDNGGESWKLVSPDHRLTQRAWYYMHVYADPRDPDTVYVTNVQFLKSIDGGRSWSLLRPPHGDNHGLWIDPLNPQRLIESNDGGATVSVDGGKHWTREDNQPTAQFYHVIADNRWPYYVYGAQQDNTTVAIASRSDSGAIDRPDWYPVGGGESGYIAPDPRDPEIVYAAGYEGEITQYNKHNGQTREITVFPELTDAMGAAKLEHRFQWTAPVLLSPHDPNVLYHGGERLFKTTDGGVHWEAISPDLTRNDKSKQIAPGGPITIDDTGTEYYDTIFAVNESPLKAGEIWVGTDDGLVQLTRDAGAHWTNITPKAMPEWSRVSLIGLSPFDPATAYVAVDRHQNDDLKPYIYKTTDYGKTWIKITSGIPENTFVRAVREDPKRRDLLYAGTENGVFVSFDGGANWRSLQLNLPHVPVHDLIVKDNDLVVATHGRSFWILDDLSPLRQFNEQIAKSEVHLYAPDVALRAHGGRGFGRNPFAGENPPSGAVIFAYLAAEPKGESTIDILDSTGNPIRHYSSLEDQPRNAPPDPEDEKPHKQLELHKGLNRFTWDLRYERVAMPPGYFLYDYQGGALGPIAVPGQYSVRLTTGGKSYTEPLTLKLDPRVNVSLADLQKQFDLRMQIRDELEKVYAVADQVLDARRQVQDLRERLKGDATRKIVLTSAESLDHKLGAMQDDAIEMRITANEDSLRYAPKVDGGLAYLAQFVEGEADAAPTEADYQTFAKYKKQADALLAEWRGLVQSDVASFQKLTTEQNISGLVLLPAKSAPAAGGK